MARRKLQLLVYSHTIYCSITRKRYSTDYMNPPTSKFSKLPDIVPPITKMTSHTTLSNAPKLMNNVLATLCAVFLSNTLLHADPVENLPTTAAAQSLKEGIARYQNTIHQLFLENKFTELDMSAADLRKTKQKLPNGGWKLAYFYDAITESKRVEEDWEADEKRLKSWIETNPKSITAFTAYAEFMTQYAWHRRGGGYASSVSEESWKSFGEAIKKAHEILNTSEKLETCPQWWATRMKVGRAEGITLAEFNKIFQAAKALEPRYYPHNSAQTIYLLPRWFGKPGDWEAAAELESKRPDGYGPAGYAKNVYELLGFMPDIFKESKASWEITKKGYEALRTSYPDSKDILNQFAILAVVAKDKPTAKKLFDEVGPDIIWGNWRQSKAYFDESKAWANSPD